MINYNTSEVVLRLSDSKDSLLVMESTEVRSAKDETATEDGGVDEIKENVETKSAEKSAQLSQSFREISSCSPRISCRRPSWTMRCS